MHLSYMRNAMVLSTLHLKLFFGYCWFCAFFCMADFGDYADHSFDCPARTTCPVVCAATAEDCPKELQCVQGEQLCVDGSCALFCNDLNFISPCKDIPCAPVACLRIVATLDSCYESFSPWYEQTCENSLFVSDTSDEASLSWTDYKFLFVYVWVLTSTLGVIGWSWFNHRVYPVQSSRKRLQIDSDTAPNSTKDASTTEDSNGASKIHNTHQIGCKRHIVGSALHYMAVMTLFGWHVILAAFPYYMYNEENNEDLMLVLKAYTVVLHVGFAWSCVLYWPHSIESIFFRRCSLEDATYVAVYHIWTSEFSATQTTPNIWFHWLYLDKLTHAWSVLMRLFFADDCVRIKPEKGILQYCKVHTSENGTRYFVFLFRRYIFDKSKNRFIAGSWSVGKTFNEMAPKGINILDEIESTYVRAVEGLPSSSVSSCELRKFLQNEMLSPMVSYLSEALGLSDEEVLLRRSIVGPNIINMEEPSLFLTLREEISRPFYLYQFYILWIWMFSEYWFMSIVNWGIVFMTACTISFFRSRNGSVLYKIARVQGKARVLRGDNFISVSQSELVPGDRVWLAPGIVHCDMVLLAGETIVDESALTGEATPQAKAPIDPTSNEVFDPKLHKNQIILTGTKVQECRDALALVYKTASYTYKGELLQEILAFRRHKPQYETDIPVAIVFLVIYSVVLAIVVFFQSGADTVIAWILAMTTWSNLFPPLLPLSFIVPVGYAFDRLSKKNITCSNTDSILMSGKVSIAFFDKTGTLTKQGLDFDSCRSVESWNVGCWSSEMLSIALACCHTLTKSEGGKLIGNPVDRAMFNCSDAKLIEATSATAVVLMPSGNHIKILRRFDFDHGRMTQSVIALLPDGKLMAVVKGSGEKLMKLCLENTIPPCFQTTQEKQSRKGLYQIAVAIKELDSQGSNTVASVSREEMESGLSFIGVLNFANRLRENTYEVITQLQNANIQTVMVTRDSIFTGIHVAKEAGIIRPAEPILLAISGNREGKRESDIWRNEMGGMVEAPNPKTQNLQTTAICITGETWQHILTRNKKYAQSIAPFIRVFGRCSPYDKVSIVDTFVELGHKTLMCGNGGNDCGALKAAHVGIALSDSDASIVAPFTSLDKDIAAVPAILSEGRCSLASMLAVYKFIILYGNISSYSQVIMYWLEALFSDFMWTFIDGVWTISFSLTLPLALPALSLPKSRPTASLLSTHTISSIIGMILLNYAFTALAFYMLSNEPWYQCRRWGETPIGGYGLLLLMDNYEISVTFLMVSAQLIGVAIAMNYGYKFCQGWHRNVIFVVFVIGYSIWLVYVVLVPGPLSCLWRINCTNENVVRGITSEDPYPINNPFNTTLMPESFCHKLLLIMVSNIIALSLYEVLVVNGTRRVISWCKTSQWQKMQQASEQVPEQHDRGSGVDD